jgi:hypothetical protein
MSNNNLNISKFVMDSESFKALQAPLKQKYKDEPNSAIITLTAEGDLGNQGVSCSVKTGKQVILPFS